MSEVVLRLLVEQRKRLVASIMGHAERELFHLLSEDEQLLFRRKTLTAINAFCDLMRDLIKVGEETGLANEETQRYIALMYESQQRLERTLGARDG